MSEFSESYHLEANDQQAGVHLLQRANLDGVVFSPQRGWVSIFPRSEFGEPPEALVQANQGVLLHYLLDQDAGWMFEVFTGPQLAATTSGSGGRSTSATSRVGSSTARSRSEADYAQLFCEGIPQPIYELRLE